MCECGAGAIHEGTTITITPHAMNCQMLARIVAVEHAGYCYTCGTEKERERSGAWTRQWCPKGHSEEMWCDA